MIGTLQKMTDILRKWALLRAAGLESAFWEGKRLELINLCLPPAIPNPKRNERLRDMDIARALSNVTKAKEKWRADNDGPAFPLLHTAVLLGINKNDVADLIRTGDLKARHEGPLRLVSAASIDRLLAKLSQIDQIAQEHQRQVAEAQAAR